MAFVRRRETVLRSTSLVAVLLATALAGCSALPGQGPSSAEVVGETQRGSNETQHGYLVTALDARVADILAARGDTSFKGRFGDYRPAPDQRIGIGDSLTVTIWEASAGGLFSSPVVDRNSPGSHTAVIPEQVVARDGSITVPYAGRIRVAGMTSPMVEARIVQSLAGKAIEPQALVAISRNLSNTATVSGEVVQGARVPLSPRGDKILDVLASAGGIRAPVHESFVTLTRDGRSVKVPMQTLLTAPQENIFVRAGDTIVVEKAPQSFTAFGAAGRNAVVTFDAVGITLEEGIAKAGGLLGDQSDPEGVFLLRIEPASVARQIDPTFVVPPGRTMVEVVYRINMRDTNSYFLARKVRVQDKDILYVASSPLNDLQKVLSVVAPAISSAYTARRINY